MSPGNIYIIVSAVFVFVIGYDIYNWLKGRELQTEELRIQLFRQKINFTVLILGGTLLGASILFHVNILQYRSPVEYKDVGSITLKDFKGYKLPSQTLDGSKQFAFIATSIAWYQHDGIVEIKSLFHPSRSYVFNENAYDKYLLQHELYHFHITEVYARKIRKELLRMKQIPAAGQIRNIVSVNERSEAQMQLDYDNETYHGYVLKKQKFWQLKVDSLLSLYSNFNKTIIQIPLVQ